VCLRWPELPAALAALLTGRANRRRLLFILRVRRDTALAVYRARLEMLPADVDRADLAAWEKDWRDYLPVGSPHCGTQGRVAVWPVEIADTTCPPTQAVADAIAGAFQIPPAALGVFPDGCHHDRMTVSWRPAPSYPLSSPAELDAARRLLKGEPHA
jgi:hypothetical protein